MSEFFDPWRLPDGVLPTPGKVFTHAHKQPVWLITVDDEPPVDLSNVVAWASVSDVLGHLADRAGLASRIKHAGPAAAKTLTKNPRWKATPVLHVRVPKGEDPREQFLYRCDSGPDAEAQLAGEPELRLHVLSFKGARRERA